MSTTYDNAVAELYRARLEVFVAERKRLAAELKAAGDKAGAARFAKLGRPPISAWAVNQLWWHERPAFEELLVVAARLRAGERAATASHRELLARLRTRAGALLGDAGHAATDATLRRVTATLSAIAAAGTFDPDPAGALTTDRAPPGFDAMGFDAALASPPGPAPRDMVVREGTAQVVVLAEAAERRREEQERAAAAERAAAERAAAERSRTEAAERARRLAELAQLDAELRSRKHEAEAQEREIGRLRRELSAAEAGLQRTRVTLHELEARLAALETLQRAALDSKS